MRPLLPLLAALALAPLAAAATSPAFGAAGTPRFDAYPADAGLRNVNNAGEPSIGIPWDTNHAFFQSLSSTYRVAFDDARLEDGKAGAAWTDVSPAFTRINVDPMLLVDHVSNRIWAGGLLGPCSLMGYSDDDGATWLPTGNMCTFAQFDHQSIGSGRWAPDTLPRGALHPRATYYCAQLQVFSGTPGTACTTSLDGGVTWLPFTEVLGGCGGLHGHIRVSEVTGTAALPDGSCNAGEPAVPGGAVVGDPARLGFGYTTDNGVTWQSRTVPGSLAGERGFDPSLDFSEESGWLYYAQANDQGIHVAMSKDEGVTWETLGGRTPGAEPAVWLNLSTLYRDAAGNPIRYATFTDTLAGDDGRAAVAFLATTAPDGRFPYGNTRTDATGVYEDPCPNEADANVWHPYLAQTFDAGQTWNVTRLWDDPIQVGSIWDQGGSVTCRNLLDFAGMDMDARGRLHIALADGCIEACAAAYAKWVNGTGDAPRGRDSADAYATILRQATGLGLYAREDGNHTAPGDGTGTSTEPARGMPGVGLAALLAGLAAGATAFRRRGR